MDFTNKNVLITGGSTGIGFATAKAFIEKGAHVFITGKNADNLAKAATQINSTRLTTIVSDTANLASISSLSKTIAATAQKLDVLFLNAAIAKFAPITEVTEEEFDMHFDTNVKGVLFTLQKMIPYLTEGASVLFTSSIVATTSGINGSVYSATKAAVNSIGRIAANELASKKIRVNIVSPGPVLTPGFDKAAGEEAKNYFGSATALQRMGEPDEIAKTVLFLASDDASFITGTEVVADGGFINYALK